jgi:hypothetical protein
MASGHKFLKVLKARWIDVLTEVLKTNTSCEHHPDPPASPFLQSGLSLRKALREVREIVQIALSASLPDGAGCRCFPLLERKQGHFRLSPLPSPFNISS